MSDYHNTEHQQLKAQVEDLYRRLTGSTNPTPAPSPTPAPTPAPAGDSFDFSAGTLPGTVTVARATSGYSKTATTTTSRAVNVARFQTTTTGNVGLIVEKAGTNTLQNGLSPGVTGWTSLGAGATVTSGLLGPDTTTTATRLQMAASGDGIRKQCLLGGAGNHHMGVWLKSNTGVAQDIFLRDPATNAYTTVSVGTAWKWFNFFGSLSIAFNFDIANAMSTAADILAWGGSFIKNDLTDISTYPSNSAADTTRAKDVVTFTGLSNGTRDIEIDYVDEGTALGSVVTAVVNNGVTVAAGTYVYDPSVNGYSGRVWKAVRFTTASAPPAPSPPPPSPGTTIFSTQMMAINDAIPLTTMIVQPNPSPNFKYCGGYVNDSHGGGGSSFGTWMEFCAKQDAGQSNTLYPAAPNSMLEVTYMRTYIDRNDGLGWVLLQICDDISKFYHWDYYDKRGYDINGYPVIHQFLSQAVTGGYKVPLDVFRHATHPVMHHYPNIGLNGAATWNSHRISIQLIARKVLINTSGTDDRANIPIMGHVAADHNTGSEFMHGTFITIPDNGNKVLLTCTNIDVPKACASCGNGGAQCYDYNDGVFSAAQLDASPPPIPTF